MIVVCGLLLVLLEGLVLELELELMLVLLVLLLLLLLLLDSELVVEGHV